MMDTDMKLQAEDPWVCPNDRELGLRAKLDSGWSFYTNRHQAGKRLPIKKEEICIIEGIIKKAEEVTLREEFRIGRLVDRLENIKNNAQGNGITTCLLCNEKFGKITATPIKCSICEKAACAKCGVDTMSSANEPIFLCKLCNEQREFWKKSGAWFFRQLPKHELPPARERQYMSSGSFIVPTPELKNKKESVASELYSDSDVESYSSSEDLVEDHRRRKSLGQTVGKDKPQASDGLHEKPKYESDVDENDSDYNGLQRSSALTANDFSRRREEAPDRGSQRSANDTSDGEPESKNSMILRHSPLLVRKNKRPSNHSNHSIHSGGSDGSLSSDAVSDQNSGRLHPPKDHKDGSNGLSNSKEELKGPLGVLEFTVNYIKDDRRLEVHIHHGKGLRAMDSSGFSDPYVKVHLLPGAKRGNKTRTQTIKKTLDPVFNETLTYHGITEEDMKNKTLRLQVLDEDKLARNDFIGEIKLPLTAVLLTNNRRMQKILQPKSEDKADAASPGEFLGRIYISLRYVSKDSKLVVGIIRCSSLAAMDVNGYSDPYVKCYLLPDPNKKSKQRTKTKKRNLNPEFNEHFSYKIAPNDLASCTLEITVWDEDFGKPNEFIGGIHLGVKSQGQLLKQWFETLKYHNKESKYWHSLTKDITLNEAE
ncbi:rabphilin-3A-like [Dendronephthya gigantea]|uniref:rabphilin-3A-like n=1 Tax=Dendronephthya gigantea TaxID=151771 RepID=UPI00106C6A26|nr:rabphilin-3A-like [Dendronephthya gigantea]